MNAQHDTVQRIAAALASTGSYAAAVRQTTRQAVVDVWWAAHAAGRQLGRKVDVLTTEPPRSVPTDDLVLISIRLRPTTTVPLQRRWS